MAVTTTAHLDVSQVLSACLADVEGLRVYAYVADTTRPPQNGGAAVIAQPTITWNDESSGFCWARFEVPISIVTTRSNEREAQQELSRLVRDVANALNHAAVEGVASIEMIAPRPGVATVSGQELPSYLIRVAVLA